MESTSRLIRGRAVAGLVGALALALALSGACVENAPRLRTLNGTEDPAVLADIRGTILAVGPLRPLVAVSLPELSTRIVRAKNTQEAGITAVAGPDENGRLVLVENRPTEGRFALNQMDLRGPGETEVFERTGDAVWGHVIGQHLALAARGGRVAFVGRHGVTQMHTPEASIAVGTLEVWSIETRARLLQGVDALDRTMAWFPDVIHLAYSALLTQDQVVAENPGQAIGGGFDAWPRVPAVMVLDATTGQTRFITVGWDPIPAPDGQTLLYSDATGIFREITLDRHGRRPVEWPGDWGGPLAFLGTDVILYWGLPTTGIEEQLDEKNAPLGAPRGRATLKAAQTKTGRFKTVLGAVDPRWRVSFGRAASN